MLRRLRIVLGLRLRRKAQKTDTKPGRQDLLALSAALLPSSATYLRTREIFDVWREADRRESAEAEDGVPKLHRIYNRAKRLFGRPEKHSLPRLDHQVMLKVCARAAKVKRDDYHENSAIAGAVVVAFAVLWIETVIDGLWASRMDAATAGIQVIWTTPVMISCWRYVVGVTWLAAAVRTGVGGLVLAVAFGAVHRFLHATPAHSATRGSSSDTFELTSYVLSRRLVIDSIAPYLTGVGVAFASGSLVIATGIVAVRTLATRRRIYRYPQFTIVSDLEPVIRATMQARPVSFGGGGLPTNAIEEVATCLERGMLRVTVGRSGNTESGTNEVFRRGANSVRMWQYKLAMASDGALREVRAEALCLLKAIATGELDLLRLLPSAPDVQDGRSRIRRTAKAAWTVFIGIVPLVVTVLLVKMDALQGVLRGTLVVTSVVWLLSTLIVLGDPIYATRLTVARELTALVRGGQSSS